MASALGHLENAVYHFKLVKRTLDAYAHTLKCFKKNSVSVMDIGCGTGRSLLEQVVPTLPKDFSEVIGVDKYDTMVEYCRKLEVDPRVSFRRLDIQTKEIPKKFERRFDLITSFFSLNYVTDYDVALRNIRSMLKSQGEIFYIQPCDSNPLYETYKELSKIKSWKSYVEDFENFTVRFSGNDRETELKNLFRKNNLKILEYEFMVGVMELIPKNFIDTFKALDTIGNHIPEDQKIEYIKDFNEGFSKALKFDFVNKESLEKKADFTFEFLIVHAQNL